MTAVLELKAQAAGARLDASTGSGYRCPPELVALNTVIGIVAEHSGQERVQGGEADKLLRQIDDVLSGIPTQKNHDGNSGQETVADHGWLRRRGRRYKGDVLITQTTKGSQEHPRRPQVFLSQFSNYESVTDPVQDTRIAFQFSDWLRVARIQRKRNSCEVSVTIGTVGDVRGRQRRRLVINGGGR